MKPGGACVGRGRRSAATTLGWFAAVQLEGRRNNYMPASRLGTGKNLDIASAIIISSAGRSGLIKEPHLGLQKCDPCETAQLAPRRFN